MTITNILLLVLYSVGMALGQVLFKVAADRVADDVRSGFFRALLLNGYFAAAVVVYASLTVLWVWVLMRVPLSRAYPFVVLAFVFTPALAFLFFDERVTGWYVVGMMLVLAGLAILVLKAGST